MNNPAWWKKSSCVFLTILISGAASQADVRLPGLFSKNMVLQQGKPVPVWGWADDGETVNVEINDQKVSTQAASGKWKVVLPELKAGGPYTLKVSGKNNLELSNILVGEVWICSGQSNMEWPLRASFEPKDAIESAANDQLRLFTVPKLKSNQPVDDIKSSWQISNPEAVPNFSAVAYFFGRDLQKALNVPVGLIHTSWGGSPAEVWMREDLLAANELYKTDILESYAAQLKRQQDWDAKAEEAKKDGKPAPTGRPGLGWKPSELYNGMIAPLIPFAINGAIWYQGESNAGKAWQYRTLFADMIGNWRQDFGQGDFTFLEVQLAPWDKGRKRDLAAITAEPGESDWAELREAQLLATKVLPRVGMAVITDIGDKDDIHPNKKEPVGARLALLAQRIAYGKRLTSNGPTYRSLDIKGDKAILSFNSVGQGLTAKDGSLKGFSIAGADKKFVWADAAIEGNTVVVSSPKVPNPVAVRYGWADFPVVNLSNSEGLPATPFRTDSFPSITGPKIPAKQ